MRTYTYNDAQLPIIQYCVNLGYCQVFLDHRLCNLNKSVYVWVLQVVVCRKKESKGVSEEHVETEVESGPSEEEMPGSLNITDEMKRMLNQL